MEPKRPVDIIITIIDGYTDEPSCLGVPPYIAPLPRYIYGAIRSWNKHARVNYITIDEYRNAVKSKKGVPDFLKSKIHLFNKSNYLIVIAGALVPGKYLRGRPISITEATKLGAGFTGIKIIGGAAVKHLMPQNDLLNIKDRHQLYQRLFDVFDHICTGDLDAMIFDFFSNNLVESRIRSNSEWNLWSKLGTEIIKQHPDYPQSLMIELEGGRGCVRFFSNGCSFCSEPEFGEPLFRKPDDIIDEVKLFNKLGIKHFRIGAISCIFSYFAKGIGETETPVPNVNMIKKLLTGIRRTVPNLEVLHLDNANPAIIIENINESEKILKVIVNNCTSGNVLSLGLESADPKVLHANNLNTDPDEVFKVIELMNKYGSSVGSSGLPKLLPGLNFVYGIKGESKNTFKHNLDFLKKVLDENLLLRRINLRQVIQITSSKDMDFNTKKLHKEFIQHKNQVRVDIDRQMLKRICPKGTILKNIYTELASGNITFGRQLGTYPILVGIPYKLNLYQFINSAITDYGFRSVTGFSVPFKINTASISAIKSLPGIGSKRAVRLIRTRPFRNILEVQNALDDKTVLNNWEKLLSFEQN